MEMCPSSFSISPSSADTREDFPQPTCPTTASRERCGTIRFILRTNTHQGTSVKCIRSLKWLFVLFQIRLANLLVQSRRILFCPGELPIDNRHWAIWRGECIAVTKTGTMTQHYQTGKNTGSYRRKSNDCGIRPSKSLKSPQLKSLKCYYYKSQE